MANTEELKARGLELGESSRSEFFLRNASEQQVHFGRQLTFAFAKSAKLAHTLVQLTLQ